MFVPRRVDKMWLTREVVVERENKKNVARRRPVVYPNCAQCT